MRWLEALAKKARPDDDAGIADRMAEAYDASSRGDYARAPEIWGPLAQGGVPRAQNNIGASSPKASASRATPNSQRNGCGWRRPRAMPSASAIARRFISRAKASNKIFRARWSFIAPPRTTSPLR
jgi:hypothetical protein